MMYSYDKYYVIKLRNKIKLLEKKNNLLEQEKEKFIEVIKEIIKQLAKYRVKEQMKNK